VVEALAQRGHQIVVLDDLSTGKKANIELLLRNTNVKFIQGSITQLPLLLDTFKGVQYVFHLAAIPSVPRSIENPLVSNEANLTGNTECAVCR